MKVYRQRNEIITEVEFEEVKRFTDFYTEIEVDTETTGLDPITDDIICIQLGCPEVQYLIEWDEELIPFLKELFWDTSKTFIFQNAKFDLQFFYKHRIVFPNNIYDTFLAECVIYCGLDFIRKGLDALGERYLDVDISKAIRSDIPALGLTPEVIKYSLNDVRYLTLIKREQEKVINKNSLTNAVRLDCSFVRALAYMEFCGIGFDQESWLKKAYKDKLALNEVIKELNDAVIAIGDPRFVTYGDLFSGEGKVCNILWSSDTQPIPFFESLGLDLWIEEKGVRKKSIGTKVITPQKDKHPIIPLFMKFQKLAKLVSSFGEDYIKFVNPVTGRIHTTFKQIVNTGRMSCGNSKQNKPNLQQVPRGAEHRGCFIAGEGNVILASDYSSQEARVFANKCLDENLLNFYDSGESDMHSLVAKMSYPELRDCTLKEIATEYPDKRQSAKSIGFAIQFGGNGYTIANNASIPLEEGEAIYKAYMDGFSGIAKYFDEQSAFVLSRGYVYFNDITKRRSYIPFFKEFKKDEAEVKAMDWKVYRQEKALDSPLFRNVLKPKVQNYFRKKGDITRISYNYSTQGTAADITKTAACIIFNKILENDWFMKVMLILSVHDEILTEFPEEMTEIISPIVKDAMERAGDIFYTRVRLTATPQIGKQWEH